MNKSIALRSAIAGLIALGMSGAGHLAAADEAMKMMGPAKMPKGAEKCFGIAKAGMNDCAGESHGCAGMAMATRSPGDFVKVPIGTCARLYGGMLGGEGGGGEAG